MAATRAAAMTRLTASQRCSELLLLFCCSQPAALSFQRIADWHLDHQFIRRPLLQAEQVLKYATRALTLRRAALEKAQVRCWTGRDCEGQERELLQIQGAALPSMRLPCTLRSGRL